ncbi:triose-phosphate isomerase [Arhodomonas sp. SL1]|uniref:triose-phosphate isomerase n=1 Tax=Arhodomonas sp. SL1 TaxID=3425691 RepID=UPI003F8832E9
MRQPLVIGNWKMNGSLAEARALAVAVADGVEALHGVRVGVMPPMVHIPAVAEALAGTQVSLGAQNVADADAGAYTGEVSAAMLAELGCTYALVGHSERRGHYNESDDLVAARFAAAGAGGVTPVLCVGETLEQRRSGETEAVIARQIDAVAARLGGAVMTGAVIAYEPVWAIGTGESAAPEQIRAVHGFIRRHLGSAAAAVLYGGSVKADNAAALFALEEVDGALVGGASLRPGEFLSICRAAAACPAS